MSYWTVTFKLKLGHRGIDGFVPVMNALQEQGWRPSLDEPSEDGWQTVTCLDVEADKGEQAAGMVSHVCVNSMDAPWLDADHFTLVGS